MQRIVILVFLSERESFVCGTSDKSYGINTEQLHMHFMLLVLLSLLNKELA